MYNHTNVRNGVQIPTSNEQAPDRARLIIEQAQDWAGFVLDHGRMKAATVYKKALDSITFSLEMKARAFAVPSKLSGTSRYQEALKMLHDVNPMRGHRLRVSTENDQITAAFSDVVIGQMQDKHAMWLRPLLTFGATVHFLTITGIDRSEGFYGCNIAIANVAAAIERLNQSGGDGAAQSVELAEDVYLWRDRQGTAQSNVPHFVRHSPTGIEWGYGGSGPADLALSILRRFTDPDTAERLYQRFKEDVIATVPHEGGLIRAAFVISWLYAQGA